MPNTEETQASISPDQSPREDRRGSLEEENWRAKQAAKSPEWGNAMLFGLGSQLLRDLGFQANGPEQKLVSQVVKEAYSLGMVSKQEP